VRHTFFCLLSFLNDRDKCSNVIVNSSDRFRGGDIMVCAFGGEACGFFEKGLGVGDSFSGGGEVGGLESFLQVSQGVSQFVGRLVEVLFVAIGCATGLELGIWG
jgi:hypothetical protein